MLRFLTLALLMFSIGQTSATDVERTQSGVESLGRDLLDDLAPDVLKRPSAPPRDGREEAKPKPGSRNPASRQPRFDDLGEDIGHPSGPMSLVRVRQGMQQAESLLGATDSAADGATLREAGAVQQQVVEQLDKLIAELSKQCQGGQCETGTGQNPSAQPKPGAAAGRGNIAAPDSTTRLGSPTPAKVEVSDIDELVKQLWGHLPERSREQMLQSFSEEFLPKYELEIQQYYRRLSEQSEAESPR